MVKTRASKRVEKRPIVIRSKRVGGANRIITWNMRGGGVEKFSKLRAFLRNPTTRVVCLQECGNPANLPKDAGWTLVAREWKASPQGNPRCSLAIYVRGEVGGTKNMNAAQSQHRPVLGVKFSQGGVVMTIWNVHAPSGQNNPNTEAYITQVLRWAAMENRRFVIAGDFNRTPAQIRRLAATAVRRKIKIAALKRATHQGGGNYDCFAHSDGISVSPRDAEMVDSDHCWVSGEMIVE